jgi:hypothetical protein
MCTAGRCKGVLSCAPSVTCLFIVHSLSWRPSALEHAPFRRRSAFHIATSTIIMVRSTSLMFSPTFSATLCAGRGGIVLHTLSPPLPAFTGGGSPCVFRGRPRYSRCHELLASLRRRQTDRLRLSLQASLIWRLPMRHRACFLSIGAAALLNAMQPAFGQPTSVYARCTDGYGRPQFCYYGAVQRCRVTMSGLGVCVPSLGSSSHDQGVAAERLH